MGAVSATTVAAKGISHGNAHMPTKERERWKREKEKKDFNKNVTTAESLDTPPGSVQHWVKERKGKENGKAKAKESGKSTEAKKIGIGRRAKRLEKLEK